MTATGPAAREGGTRVPDVFIFDTASGLAPHLVDSTSPEKTVCGLAPSRPSRTWFSLAGCRKCRRAAVKAGIATVTDVDGDRIDL